METKPRNSPITMKLMAVKEDLNELDAEINSITLELDTNDDFEPEPVKEETSPKTVPVNTNISRYKTAQKQISQRTPEFNKKYEKKFQTKKVSQTPNFNINSTMHIEDLMSSDEDVSNSNSKIISTPKKLSFRQSKSSQESKNKNSCKSIHHSPSQSNYSNTSSISNSSRQIDEETNRLYMQSVKIVEKRTHSRFNNDPWFQYNDNDQESISNSENPGFVARDSGNEDLYFPKQSTFSYNSNRKSGYKPITEMDRINETQRKREKMAFQRQQEKEREIEKYTFKPILSTHVISNEEKEKIQIKKQQKNEESTPQSSKTIRFIDPNSERIANKAKMKPNSKKQIDHNGQDSPSPKVKYLSPKQIKKSCERLSKPKQILTNSDNENDDFEEEEENRIEPNKKRKKKFADPEAIERLFQNSTKNKQLNRNSDLNENENQNNFNNSQEQRSPHSFMDSKSREIIEKSAKYRNSNDLFEDSIQVAEEKFRVSREIQKYNEMRDSDYSYRPKINQTSPHFTANTTDYSTLMNSPTTTATTTYSNSPNAKKIYYDAKFSQMNQSSPLRKSYIVSPSPVKKRKEKKLVSESEINKIMDEVDAQLDSLSNV